MSEWVSEQASVPRCENTTKPTQNTKASRHHPGRLHSRCVVFSSSACASCVVASLLFTIDECKSHFSTSIGFSFDDCLAPAVNQ